MRAPTCHQIFQSLVLANSPQSLEDHATLFGIGVIIFLRCRSAFRIMPRFSASLNFQPMRSISSGNRGPFDSKQGNRNSESRQEHPALNHGANWQRTHLSALQQRHGLSTGLASSVSSSRTATHPSCAAPDRVAASRTNFKASAAAGARALRHGEQVVSRATRWSAERPGGEHCWQVVSRLSRWRAGREQRGR